MPLIFNHYFFENPYIAKWCKWISYVSTLFFLFKVETEEKFEELRWSGYQLWVGSDPPDKYSQEKMYFIKTISRNIDRIRWIAYIITNGTYICRCAEMYLYNRIIRGIRKFDREIMRRIIWWKIQKESCVEM